MKHFTRAKWENLERRIACIIKQDVYDSKYIHSGIHGTGWMLQDHEQATVSPGFNPRFRKSWAGPYQCGEMMAAESVTFSYCPDVTTRTGRKEKDRTQGENYTKWTKEEEKWELKRQLFQTQAQVVFFFQNCPSLLHGCWTAFSLVVGPLWRKLAPVTLLPPSNRIHHPLPELGPRRVCALRGPPPPCRGLAAHTEV